MPQYIPLDAAAAAVKKSEVTLRRLIKAEKVDFRKEKTLTGFVYLVNVDSVKAYYEGREPVADEAEEVPSAEAKAAPVPRAEREPETEAETRSTTVRVGIANHEGSTAEYWQKRSESYEEKYHSEVGKHAQTREELGVWRGRAEQAQSMLIKLLPSGGEVEVQRPREAVVTPRESSFSWTNALLTVVVVLLVAVIAVGGYEYVKLLR